ncbi:hypothetical protein BCR41DRAFT_122830 [Lobosporangium transversale]|uniref:Ubiquitin-protein ligase E3A N-terminal zinc-binding domain-containing protein n=1 Tax=Lobosporangium transversale TaxID=64571 RepID=A0A1Y2H470_9FUNG|nr:hypothetical protein BCR41DRAFT_122830 [Lobosporangium transversale]ORZ27852.1 hypothetical protein BCR41DRAFT_122830 [Lobosporangium transversale]|eukprot:XP_021885555.1 hypothetical protein BCR41DRAFT_122830 [Lobosporangium transversale]
MVDTIVIQVILTFIVFFCNWIVRAPQSRRRHPPTSITGLPYPRQRTQSLNTGARQPRSQQSSSVIRHARNQTYSDTLGGISSHTANAATVGPSSLSSSSSSVPSSLSNVRTRPEDTASHEQDTLTTDLSSLTPTSIQPTPSSSFSTLTARADQQLITRYLRQLLQGCGINSCQTPYCASNVNFSLKDPKEVANKAAEMASKGPGELCPRLELSSRSTSSSSSSSSSGPQGEIVADPTIDLDIVSFKALIDQCKAEQSYGPLLARLQVVFSSLSRLSMSFADAPKTLSLCCYRMFSRLIGYCVSVHQRLRY